MRCLSCSQEARGGDLRFLEGMALCSGCYALGENIKRRLDTEIEAARQNCYSWLQQHILKGGLFRGRLSGSDEVPGLRRQEEGHSPDRG